MQITFKVEQVLRDVLQPTKINLASLGNKTPHIHWHVIPRFEKDVHFPETIWSAEVRQSNKPIIVGYRTTKYILTDFDPIMITFNGLISKCWNTTYSGNIFLTTSVNLSQNRINHPINFIPGGSVKIMELYSILVRQYGLSEGKYNYLEKMKKNTEQTGSVFDAQPSELVGNIHCVSNPSEPVIGYMDISQIQEVRKFIRNKDLPDWNYTPPCLKVEVENNMDSITAVHSTLEPAYVAQYSPRGGILSFYFSTPECIDCRYHGSTIKPSFWPQ
jgi:hypothetical protein